MFRSEYLKKKQKKLKVKRVKSWNLWTKLNLDSNFKDKIVTFWYLGTKLRPKSKLKSYVCTILKPKDEIETFR